MTGLAVLPQELSLRGQSLPGAASGPGPASVASRGKGHWGWGLLAVVVVAGVGVWAFGGLVHTALHIAELVAVGGACGWAGFRLGQARGRRQALRSRHNVPGLGP